MAQQPSDIERLGAQLIELRELIKDAHAATKDLRGAIRDAKAEAANLGGEEVRARIAAEVDTRLTRLGEATEAATAAAVARVLAGFDGFGESLLGKETWWHTAAGRKADARQPEADRVLPAAGDLT